MAGKAPNCAPSLSWRVRLRRGESMILARTMATMMRSIGIDRLVVSKILNHAEAGVTKIYDRYRADPEKTAAVERWANHLRKIIGRGCGRQRRADAEEARWRCLMSGSVLNFLPCICGLFFPQASADD